MLVQPVFCLVDCLRVNLFNADDQTFPDEAIRIKDGAAAVMTFALLCFPTKGYGKNRRARHILPQQLESGGFWRSNKVQSGIRNGSFEARAFGKQDDSGAILVGAPGTFANGHEVAFFATPRNEGGVYDPRKPAEGCFADFFFHHPSGVVDLEPVHDGEEERDIHDRLVIGDHDERIAAKWCICWSFEFDGDVEDVAEPAKQTFAMHGHANGHAVAVDGAVFLGPVVSQGVEGEMGKGQDAIVGDGHQNGGRATSFFCKEHVASGQEASRKSLR